MAEWASVNIRLLLLDRCAKLLSHALKILDGLMSFHTDIIGTPSWTSAQHLNTPLFLLKLYLSNKLINTNELINFLELPSDIILLIGIKQTFKNITDNDASRLADSLDLTDFNESNETEYKLALETLIHFDQILITTMLDIWLYHQDKAIQMSAAHKLKAKMTAMEIITATKATSTAINKAADNLNSINTKNLYTDLRIANLEASLKRNEQKTNEMANIIKNKRNAKINEKNYKGSHLLESMASPMTPTPQHTTLKMVDLTTDNEEEEEDIGIIHKQKASPFLKNSTQYQQKRQKMSHANQKKSIQWQQVEIQEYNPQLPTANSLRATHHQMTNLRFGSQNPPLFPPAPQPNALMAPSPNPFVIPHNFPHTQNFHNKVPQNTHNPFINPFLQMQPVQPTKNRTQNQERKGNQRKVTHKKRSQHHGA
jgi:hypothetical protein